MHSSVKLLKQDKIYTFLEAPLWSHCKKKLCILRLGLENR